MGFFNGTLIHILQGIYLQNPKITTNFIPEEYYYESISLTIYFILSSSHYFKGMQGKEQTYILTL